MPVRSRLTPWFLACSLLAACGASGESSPPPSTPAGATAAPAGSGSAAASHGSPSVPHIKGRLSPDDVQRIVRIHLYRVQDCYSQGLSRNSKLAGKIVFNFVIGPDGTVGSINDQGSTLGDPEVIACAKAVFTPLQFKPPEDGNTVTVTYPIELKRGAPAAP